MTDGEKVRLTGVAQTALITLAARALESRSGGVLHDPWAERALQRIDYDFGQLRLHRWRASVIAARARQLDLWTTRFLEARPDAVVLHPGCGLDSRIFRVDPPAGVRWFDIDYPQTIQLRRRLYAERPGYTLIAASLAHPGWLDELPRERPAILVAEGVMQYLTGDTVVGLLRRVLQRFPAGEMAFDVHSATIVRMAARRGWTVGDTGAVFRWGLNNPRELQRMVPGLELLEEVRLHTLARRFRLPWRVRAVLRAIDWLPALRAMTCLHWRF